MKRLICTMVVLLALCVPTRAEGVLTTDEAMDIILEHHGVETEIDTIWNPIVLLIYKIYKEGKRWHIF